MASRVFIAGGYGLVGGNIARQIRAISQETELVLAGRNPEKGAALARDLGGATTAFFDFESTTPASVDVASADLIVSALDDPANTLFHAALARGIGHIGITTKADDLAPIVSATLQSPPGRPVVVLGHCTAGVATLVAQKAARAFNSVETIELAALYDERDPLGPMAAGDAELLISRALLRETGKWIWVEGPRHPRTVRAGGATLEGYPVGLLDAPSLAATTGAANVRLDLVQGISLGTAGGGPASSDLYIDIAGILASGKAGRVRTILSDPKGLAHLTALGVLAAVDRVLGLDGEAPAAGGLYLPETLASPNAAIARFEQFGVRVMSE